VVGSVMVISIIPSGLSAYRCTHDRFGVHLLFFWLCVIILTYFVVHVVKGLLLTQQEEKYMLIA
jgi:hypothetical protein